jgi:uncharacterized tellurite resistance protein B-like protein
MKDFLGRVFGAGQDGPAERSEVDVRVAACALFLEMANIDNEFSEVERQQILTLLREEFDLDEEHALALAREAAAELEGSTDLWHFTHQINDNYSNEEKLRVVELLWQIVYADGHVDAHEDYLVHKMTKLLRLPHKAMIEAKLRVTGGERDEGSEP